MSQQLQLGVTSVLREEEAVVYVASPISSLAGDGREEIEQDCVVIKAAAEATADTDDPPWTLRAHVPCLESSPWVAPDTPPEQIFDQNHRLVAEEADAPASLPAEALHGRASTRSIRTTACWSSLQLHRRGAGENAFVAPLEPRSGL